MGTFAGKHHWMLALSLLLLGQTVRSATASSEGRSGKLYPDKPPVMTIKTEHGDLVDCVDFYSQPAFGHPALKNHIIQMEPSSPGDEVPVRILHAAEDKANWRRSRSGSGISCPLGTVPILRPPDNLPSAFTTKSGRADSDIHEYAALDTRGTFNGTTATFNVWNPHVDSRSGSFSLAQLWVASGDQRTSNYNTIEVGFHVYPDLYTRDNQTRDNQTRLFTFWTSDNYDSTGCYNLCCPGFVQLSNQICPGMVISPVSVYRGNQVYVQISVVKDAANGRWNLIYDNTLVGYWPNAYFTTLAEGSADDLTWGGEVCRSPNRTGGATGMGSGHFPSEGRDGISASVKNITCVDASGNVVPPTATSPIVPNNTCFDIENVGITPTDGYVFYFGGPGKSEIC